MSSENIEYSPTSATAGTMPAQDDVPDVGDSPRAVSRPTLLSANSGLPLLADESPAATPGLMNSPNPFGDSNNPSRQGSSSTASHDSSANLTPSSSSSESKPNPEIHIIPNSPDNDDIPSFAPQQSFSTPFADPNDEQRHVQYDTFNEKAKSTAVATAGANIISRRSMRMKNTTSMMSSKSNKRLSQKDEKKGAGLSRKPFQSTRLKGEIYKPWLEKKDPAQRWARWITIVSIIIGIGLAGFRECISRRDLRSSADSPQSATMDMPLCPS